MLAGLVCAGCSTPDRFHDPHRYRQGVVFILPGIEGRSPWNRNIALGLDEGGVRAAIEVYDWTIGLPGGFVVNLTNIDRNRNQAEALAARILEQRRKHPGSPIHVIGHSAGGGIAVLTLEALPPGRQIDTAILLAPALSREHDMTTALRRVRAGIYNFYSELDVGFLVLGTSSFGTVDRDFGASGGALGFLIPEHLDRAGRDLYARRLHQISWNPRLVEQGATGGHFGWASRQFAREYLAPLILEKSAPPPTDAAASP
jgi:pimeloyl-ACP methyl ester carboxylesterase